MTLTEMKAELTLIENQISSLLEVGQEYSITGSHAAKNPKPKELNLQRSKLERRILRYHGCNTKRSQYAQN